LYDFLQIDRVTDILVPCSFYILPMGNLSVDSLGGSIYIGFSFCFIGITDFNFEINERKNNKFYMNIYTKVCANLCEKFDGARNL